MKITEVTTDLLRVPPTVALQDAIQNITTWEWILVTIETDSGLTARGWTYSLGMGGSAIRDLIDVYLRPLLLGADPQDVDKLWHRLNAEIHAVGNAGVTSMAIAAVDIALWDVIGQHLKLPLYRLWGGHRNSIPAYASGLNLHLEGDGLAQQLTEYVDRGYRAVKVKVGSPDIEVDVERIKLARNTIGSNVELFLDANQVWQASDAIRRIRRLEQFSPSWIEEPVLAEDTAGNARVRAGVGTPVALGESLFTRYQFADVIRAEAVDIIQADIARVGGFSEFLKIAHLASAHNLQMAPHFMSELSVHALCAIDNGRVMEDIEGGTLAELGLTQEPLRIVNGMAYPPDRPGHGVVFDQVALDRHRVTGSFTVEPTRRS